ncbi:rhodanese-like domain-containing protein [Desertivirga brevis]|uniref:rhodanese-like domain-containing protein n=1 Tax=Desertivirga brevis TaxID=2810310 RepID=UPI001A972BDD|nr:rhodanese-like domain-containing protein [Pedobacter sp. SYSU D00873]
MKVVKLLIVLLSVSAFAFAQTSHRTYNQKSPYTIEVDQTNRKEILRELEEGKAFLIDVRTPEEYREKHLRNARNIDFRSKDFAAKIGQLDKSKKVYLYCRSGNRSGQARDSLISLGYSYSYNIGALDSIVDKGFPVAR